LKLLEISHLQNEADVVLVRERERAKFIQGKKYTASVDDRDLEAQIVFTACPVTTAAAEA
jgi:hypothetical protein